MVSGLWQRGEAFVCGIAGLFHGGLVRDEVAATLERMTAAMVHRGPDGSGVIAADGGGLAMRRLAVIDLAGGDQPMVNETGAVAVVMNGEVYNYRLLRERLRGAGHTFRTDSDTEVAVHSYEASPRGFPKDLRGMFSVAVWDRDRNSVTLAIDPLGIKPVYYIADVDRLCFASEMGSLMASGLVDSAVSGKALAQYFALGYVAAPESIFTAVKRLRPGEVLRWVPGEGACTETYWEVPAAAQLPPGGADLRIQVRDQLREAVRSHLISDVPVGAFLSGGVDSSAIVALMSEVAEFPVRTFSIGFADPRHDERRFARRVAQTFGTIHEELILEPSHTDAIDGIVRHFGEPFGDPASLPTYFVSRMASERVKVALSGDGADELFLGYTLYRGLEVARMTQRLPVWVRGSCEQAGRRVAESRLAGRAPAVDRLAKRSLDTMRPPRTAFRSKMKPPGAGSLTACLHPWVRRAIAGFDPFEPYETAWRRWNVDRQPVGLDGFVYGQIKVSLPDDMLCKVDRMSMAHSLEVRVPFLDQSLVEFVSGLPMSSRFPRWRRKALLRDAMRGLLPDEILDRPKHGFTIPISGWFRNDLFAFARERLLSSDARESGFYDSGGVHDLLESHARTEREVSGGLWMLLMFEVWRHGLGLSAHVV